MVRIFTDSRCLQHEVPLGFPEVPARVSSILDGLREAGYQIEESGAHGDRTAAIERVHDAKYLKRFEEAVRTGQEFLDTGDNPICGATWDAACAAVDATLHAADFVAQSPGNKAMAVVRPPGHHAEHRMAMGFCYFNNVAVAADYLKELFGIDRVAIVDFDVHHGNGTQHIFEKRADVLYVSTHRHPFYPGTGMADERGRGDGVGSTLNVPLAAGSDDEAHAKIFEEIVLPGLSDFSPEVLLISAGFDSWRGDPLGGMAVTQSGYRDWGSWLGRLADDLCQGRVLVVLEGGYDIAALPRLVVAHLEGLVG
ncbi:MAG: histone deacetylase [Acidobacteriota bacterium]